MKKKTILMALALLCSFAPQGWTVPYAGQYRKMLQNLADITGNKPDGTIGASFLTNGVYGFNT
ncbi:MAG: hypothetical protein J6W38_12790, partial [Prevotella sp.]|nr:hypothetical protein [Prevotella sp.]